MVEEATMTRRFFYSGDHSIEHGGMFYALDTWADGYVDALRVVPCNDAGGPDNCFWIETLEIHLPDGADKAVKHKQGLAEAEGKLRDAFASCGYYASQMAVDGWEKMTKAQRMHTVVQVLEGYGVYGQTSSTLVRVGGPDRFYNGREKFEPEKVLRGNIRLELYARRLCRTEL